MADRKNRSASGARMPVDEDEISQSTLTYWSLERARKIFRKTGLEEEDYLRLKAKKKAAQEKKLKDIRSSELKNQMRYAQYLSDYSATSSDDETTEMESSSDESDAVDEPPNKRGRTTKMKVDTPASTTNLDEIVTRIDRAEQTMKKTCTDIKKCLEDRLQDAISKALKDCLSDDRTNKLEKLSAAKDIVIKELREKIKRRDNKIHMLKTQKNTEQKSKDDEMRKSRVPLSNLQNLELIRKPTQAAAKGANDDDNTAEPTRLSVEKNRERVHARLQNYCSRDDGNDISLVSDSPNDKEDTVVEMPSHIRGFEDMPTGPGKVLEVKDDNIHLGEGIWRSHASWAKVQGKSNDSKFTKALTKLLMGDDVHLYTFKGLKGKPKFPKHVVRVVRNLLKWRLMNQEGNKMSSQTAEILLEYKPFGNWMTAISKECEPARILHHKKMYEKRKEAKYRALEAQLLI